MENDGCDLIAFMMNQLFLSTVVGILAVGDIVSGGNFVDEEEVGTRLPVRERYHPDIDAPRALGDFPRDEFSDSNAWPELHSSYGVEAGTN